MQHKNTVQLNVDTSVLSLWLVRNIEDAVFISCTYWIFNTFLNPNILIISCLWAEDLRLSSWAFWQTKRIKGKLSQIAVFLLIVNVRVELGCRDETQYPSQPLVSVMLSKLLLVSTFSSVIKVNRKHRFKNKPLYKC